jgi:hypothetical protein
LLEERWDSTAVPPGGAFVNVNGGKSVGCMRIIDYARRFSDAVLAGNGNWALSEWPTTDDSAQGAASAPCTGDYQSEDDQTGG